MSNPFRTETCCYEAWDLGYVAKVTDGLEALQKDIADLRSAAVRVSELIESSAYEVAGADNFVVELRRRSKTLSALVVQKRDNK